MSAVYGIRSYKLHSDQGPVLNMNIYMVKIGAFLFTINAITSKINKRMTKYFVL